MRLVNKITLKFGTRRDSAPLVLSPTGITLFVGPNNSGKSLVLREIEKFCTTNSSAGNHVLESIDFQFPDAETMRCDISASKTMPNQNEIVGNGYIMVQRINTYPGLQSREPVPLMQVEQWLTNNDRHSLMRYYVSLLTIRLDGATRTTLLNHNSRTDLLEPPTNLTYRAIRGSRCPQSPATNHPRGLWQVLHDRRTELKPTSSSPLGSRSRRRI
jgi:hypothetical protein